MTPLEIEKNISELLIHTADFLEDPNVATEDPLLYDIVAMFVSVISTYDDYKKLTKSKAVPFPFTKEIPSA